MQGGIADAAHGNRVLEHGCVQEVILLGGRLDDGTLKNDVGCLA